MKSLHPVDALVLEWLGENRKIGWTHVNTISEATDVRKTSMVVSLRNLTENGCCFTQNNGTYAISDFGEEFLRACSP
jgi:predicted transcriptional regulator